MTGRQLRRIHGSLALVWAAMVPVILLYGREAIWLVVFMSVYTIIVDHLGAWQAGRVEAKQDGQEETP
jgi:hypothetical protein